MAQVAPAPTSARFRGTVATVAVVALASGWAVASVDPVPQAELDLTTAVNSAPAWVAHGLWPAMQLGSLAGPALVGLATYAWRRSVALAAAAVGAGVAAWFVAKGVKAVVERGRPLEHLPDIVVREGSGTGFGFVSGHTAVAFAWATVVAGELGPRGRVAVFAVAGLVGLARIVHGVHLPADVLGGIGVGLGCGLAARLLAEGVPARPGSGHR